MTDDEGMAWGSKRSGFRFIIPLSVAVMMSIAALAIKSSNAATHATAHVVVTKEGLSNGPGFLGYGLVLKNTGSADAVNVTISVTLNSKTSAIADDGGLPDNQAIWRIPAHSTFYVGGLLDPAFNVKPTGVAVKLHVGGSATQHFPIPSITDVHVPRYLGGCSVDQVTAKLYNPYGRPIDPIGSTLFVVYFNRQGDIVGGDSPETASVMDSRPSSARTAQSRSPSRRSTTSPAVRESSAPPSPSARTSTN